jgi:hypothetical protein
MKKPGACLPGFSFRRLAVCSAWLACALGLFGTAPAQQPLPSADAVESMREHLQERRRERESLETMTRLAPWHTLTQAPDLRAGRDRAVVRLVNQTVAFRAVWIFDPVDNPEARPVRALLGWQGEDWVTLAPGVWRVRLIVGQPGGRGLAQPPQEVQAGRGKAYELAIPHDVEPTLREQARPMRSRLPSRLPRPEARPPAAGRPKKAPGEKSGPRRIPAISAAESGAIIPPRVSRWTPWTRWTGWTMWTGLGS